MVHCCFISLLLTWHFHSLSHGLRIFQESNDLGKDTVEAKDETEMVIHCFNYNKL